MSEPVSTLGRRPAAASVAGILGVVAAASAPGRSSSCPPPFLKVHQIDPWRRVSYALRHYGGAILAEPTGSGKSWIALAMASVERKRALVLAPAVLLEQWQAVAAQAGVPTVCWSHERVSRGALPPHEPALVIIDEAHRLREPAIRRVRTIAPWLVGRRVLLLTATPIVNRLRDLITLLHLVVPDDALALDGYPTLTALADCAVPPPALQRLVIRSAKPLAHTERETRILAHTSEEAQRALRALAHLDRLALSRDPMVKRLLRSVLLDAAASSDAAFHLALRRYRALLLQARDAGGISRAAIRHFAGEALDQLVLWDLVQHEHDSELVTDDIEQIDILLATHRADGAWIDALRHALSGEVVAVCFTRHRATAQLLRSAFGDATAWVTGSDAGIGPHRLPRATVLDAFGPRRAAWRARRAVPRILVTTDVAAEGLDLQGAGAIAHIDLPWTAMRLAQREGRLFRIGQLQERVMVVVRPPPPAIEAELAAQQRIGRKGALSRVWVESIGRGEHDSNAEERPPLVAVIHDGGPDATLVVTALTRGERLGVRVMVRHGSDPWVSTPEVVRALWERGKAARDERVDSLPGTVQAELAAALRAVLSTGSPSPPTSPALVARIQRLARGAASRRDASVLATLDTLLRFAATPTTLGGRMLLDRLGDAPDHELLRAHVVEIPRPGPVATRVVAALLFRSPASPLR